MKSSTLTAVLVTSGTPVLPLPDLFACLFLPHLVGVVKTFRIVPVNFQCKVFIWVYAENIKTVKFFVLLQKACTSFFIKLHSWSTQDF